MTIDAFVYSGNSAQKVSIDAVKGAFRFITGISKKDAYSISTPTAVIAVRGTEFDMHVDRGGETELVMFGGATLTLATHGTDQYLVQRLLSARSPKDASLGLVLSGVVVFAQFALFLLIGVMLYAYYQHAPLPTLSRGDEILQDVENARAIDPETEISAQRAVMLGKAPRIHVAEQVGDERAQARTPGGCGERPTGLCSDEDGFPVSRQSGQRVRRHRENRARGACPLRACAGTVRLPSDTSRSRWRVRRRRPRCR